MISTRDADKLKMFAWETELHCRLVEALPGPRAWPEGGPGQARGAEAQRRRVAHCGARREARVAVPRLGAPRPTLASSEVAAECRAPSWARPRQPESAAGPGSPCQ